MPSARRLPHISTAEAGRLSTNSPRSRAANVRIGLHSTRRWRAARLHRASLVVSKVDRLTRSVAFLSRLLEAGVDAQFADLPQIDGATGRSLLQQMVAVAKLEAGMISARTKAALAAAKKRGKKLGGNRGVKPTAKMRARSTADLQQRAAASRADPFAYLDPKSVPQWNEVVRELAFKDEYRTGVTGASIGGLNSLHHRAIFYALEEAAHDIRNVRERRLYLGGNPLCT